MEAGAEGARLLQQVTDPYLATLKPSPETLADLEKPIACGRWPNDAAAPEVNRLRLT